jgi:hypothetical protein
MNSNKPSNNFKTENSYSNNNEPQNTHKDNFYYLHSENPYNSGFSQIMESLEETSKHFFYYLNYCIFFILFRVEYEGKGISK